MKKTTMIAIAFGLAIAAAAGIAERNVAQTSPDGFQLIYHSDNRGYYRPCG